MLSVNALIEDKALYTHSEKGGLYLLITFPDYPAKGTNQDRGREFHVYHGLIAEEPNILRTSGETFVRGVETFDSMRLVSVSDDIMQLSK